MLQQSYQYFLHECSGHLANNIPLIFLCSLGSIQPRVAMALLMLFNKTISPSIIAGIYVYPWLMRSNEFLDLIYVKTKVVWPNFR